MIIYQYIFTRNYNIYLDIIEILVFYFGGTYSFAVLRPIIDADGRNALRKLQRMQSLKPRIQTIKII